MSHFVHGFTAAYLVGTHYDEYQDLNPSDKATIVRGLRSFITKYGAGLIFT